MCKCEYKITDGVPVSVCEFSVYACVCECNCSGCAAARAQAEWFGLMDRLIVEIYKFL